MNENERDTHFQGAAELLSEKLSALYLGKGLDAILGDPNGEIKQQEITLFAQFAYDVVYHALDTSGVYLHPDPLGPEYIADTDEIMKHVSDLTEWTKH